MPQNIPTVEEILAQIEKGERLGLPEARQLLDAANKFFGKKDLDRFFSASKKQAAKFPPVSKLDSAGIKLTGTTCFSQIDLPPTEIVYLNFPENMSFEQITQAIFAASKKKKVAALCPSQILDLSEKTGLKILEVCTKLAEAGLSFSEGKLACNEADFVAIDEYFGVLYHLNRFGIKSSAWLPNTFSEEAKIEHLFRIREFDDRTHAITHVVLQFEAMPENIRLKTVALARLMLDFTQRLSIADYQFEQKTLLSPKSLEKIISLGINLTHKA